MSEYNTSRRCRCCCTRKWYRLLCTVLIMNTLQAMLSQRSMWFGQQTAHWMTEHIPHSHTTGTFICSGASNIYRQHYCSQSIRAGRHCARHINDARKQQHVAGDAMHCFLNSFDCCYLFRFLHRIPLASALLKITRSVSLHCRWQQQSSRTHQCQLCAKVRSFCRRNRGESLQHRSSTHAIPSAKLLLRQW